MSFPTASLDGVPLEIIEEIVTYLDPTPTCNLCLTCRGLARKIKGGPHFRSFFRSKKLCWTSRSHMEAFVEATRPGRLGNLLGNLTLTARPIRPQSDVRLYDERFDPDFEDDAECELAAHLKSAFTNLRENATNPCLRSLTLSVEDPDLPKGRDPPSFFSFRADLVQSAWLMQWTYAERTFKYTLLALSAAQLSVCKIDAFGGDKFCGLATSRFAPTIDSLETCHFLRALRSVSLGISQSILLNPFLRGIDLERQMERQHPDNVSRLLGMTPQLECLELHYDQPRSIYLVPCTYEDRLCLLEDLVPLLAKVKLKKLTLSGFMVRDEFTLLELASSMQTLQSVELEDFVLEEGQFAAFFNALTKLPNLDRLRLDRLCEYDLLHFRDCTLRFPDEGHQMLELQGADVRKRIDYHDSAWDI